MAHTLYCDKVSPNLISPTVQATLQEVVNGPIDMHIYTQQGRGIAHTYEKFCKKIFTNGIHRRKVSPGKNLWYLQNMKFSQMLFHTTKGVQHCNYFTAICYRKF